MKTREEYLNSIHFAGRVWMLTGAALLLMVPGVISVYYDAWPGVSAVARGLVGVAPIFWTVAVIELFTFSPMLGAGGSYLGFLTGNLTNLKVPCALNAMQAAKVEPGSEEAEVISTIAIAISALVTTVIIIAGVFLLSWIQPIIQSETLAPAFANILPALFGGLAVVFVSKNWKVAMAPMVFMVVLFISVPALTMAVGILVPVGAIIAITSARILYKKGLV